MTFKAFVINLDRHPQRLARFYRQPDAAAFVRLPALDKQIIALLGDDGMLFDTARCSKRIGQQVMTGEIGCTLSHVAAWRNIAADPDLGDNDFALVAEDDAVFCEDFTELFGQLAQALAGRPRTECVILQKLGLHDARWRNPPAAGSRLTCITPKRAADCDHDGSALYAIRKRWAAKLTARLQSEKPFWLADEFSLFVPLARLCVVYPPLATVPTHATQSDLEEERRFAFLHLRHVR